VTKSVQLVWQRLNLDEVDWAALDAFPDRTIFQTREWLRFVAQAQRAEPVVASVHREGRLQGYFTGLMVKRFGIRILGSPFRGWTSSYMGFNLLPGVSRAAVLRSLRDFAFGELRCLHLEVIDEHLSPAEAAASGLAIAPGRTYRLDLSCSEARLLAGMSASARRFIRQAARTGRVRVEEATDAGFAEDYYAQLEDVFARQGLVPTYPLARVRELVNCLLPTGRLLLLRARDAQGRCVATGIYPAFNGTMYFWGGASWRAHQRLRPNESLHWHAICHWKARGVRAYDLVGAGHYKEKYGAALVELPKVLASRVPLLRQARELAHYGFRLMQRARGLLVRSETRFVEPALGLFPAPGGRAAPGLMPVTTAPARPNGGA
jgi:hypothetical protein